MWSGKRNPTKKKGNNIGAILLKEYILISLSGKFKLQNF